MHGNAPPREGDLYKRIEIEGHIFELRYGYYEEYERTSGEPVVIYPDLATRVLSARDGRPLVTAIQDPCEHYTVAEGKVKDECCNDCRYYITGGDDIGICDYRSAEEKRDTPVA